MKNIFLVFSTAIGACFFMAGCKKTDSGTGVRVNAVAPAISTNDATNISAVGATLGGNITGDGGSIVTEAGVCYSTSAGVDTSDNKIADYTVSGSFSVPVKNLMLLTTYYYRAYAINEKGITYGDEKSFFVPVGGGYTASSQIAKADLVAHWAFEDGYADSVSLTAGDPVHSSAISFVAGKMGKALEVASPGYVNTNVGTTIGELPTFTMACWIKQPASLSSGPTTYMPFSLNQKGYSWEQSKLFMLFNNADNATNSYGKVCLMDQWFDVGQAWPKMLDGDWHQMIISYNGTTGALRVYIDGDLLPQTKSFVFRTQDNFGEVESFTLGGPDDNAHTVNGWMNSLSGDLDEFRVYSKELSLEEVQGLYALQSRGL